MFKGFRGRSARAPARNDAGGAHQAPELLLPRQFRKEDAPAAGVELCALAGTFVRRHALRRAMSRIAAYRSYAAQCLELAEKTKVDPERRVLIEMAAGWHELALMLETYMDEHQGAEMPVSEFERLQPKQGPPKRQH